MNEYRLGFAEKIFDRAFIGKKLGADYHELNVNALHDMSEDEFNDFCNRIKAEGVSVEAAKNMIPGEMQFTIDNPNFEELDTYLEKAFSRLHKLGVKIAVLGSSGARSYPDGVTYEQAFYRLVFFLNEHLIPVCKKYNIVCALENLSIGESNILNMIDESYRVAEACNSEWVKILVDFYHFTRNNDSFDSIRKANDYIIHTHFASTTTDRKLPAKTDKDPYGDYINLLREIGYKGRLSFEAGVPDGMSFEEAGANALALFRDL